MKHTFFVATSIIAAACNGAPMKLVNTKTGFVVAEISDRNIKFHDRFLEAVMKGEGILIPPALRKNFEGKEVVFIDDPLFEKAFTEVYYPFYMANSVYRWQK